MWTVFQALSVLLLLYSSTSASASASASASPSAWLLTASHPHAAFHQKAQQIATSFATQLTLSPSPSASCNLTELRELLLHRIDDPTVQIFRLAAMTVSVSVSDSVSDSESLSESLSVNKQEHQEREPYLSSSPSPLATFPMLHLLLNRFMLSTSPVDKALLIELVELAMRHGADPSIPLNNDPPLYVKAIMIKEIGLTKSIIEHSSRAVVNDIIARSSKILKLLKLIYAIPAEVVPIAKLLLHVEKLTHKYYDFLPADAKEGFNARDVAVRLLSGAKLDRATITASELMKFSAAYNLTVQHITSYLKPENAPWNVNGKLETTKLISMFDISMSLNELMAVVQQALIKIMWDSDRNEVAIEHFIDIHVLPDEQDRNCFHYLAAANSVVMVESFSRLFDSLIDQLFEPKQSRTMTISEDKVRQFAETILNNLSQVDHRGHTPISYAETRYGSHSPIAVTLKSFITKLIRIFEGEFGPLSDDMEELIDHDGSDAYVDVSGMTFQPDEVEVGLDTDNLIATTTEDPSVEADDIAVDSLESHDEVRRELLESDGGGWNPQRLSLVDDVDTTLRSPSIENDNEGSKKYYAPCDILEIWDSDLPSLDEFFVRYINTATPVVFRGAALRASSNMHSLREKFAKKRFVRNYGTVQVTAATLPYSDSFGIPATLKTMKDVANSDKVVTASHLPEERIAVPLYTFTTPSPQWSEKLNRDVPFPEPISARSDSTSNEKVEKKAAYSYELQFYLGPAGTGAPVHFHGHAINTLAYGEKKWVMYPPNEGFYTTIAAFDFFRMLPDYDHEKAFLSLTSNLTVNQHLPDLRRGALQCTQYAGDIMYVPTMWGHGTLNTKQSIGVAHEFSVESFCME